jgi:hypothetical protein
VSRGRYIALGVGVLVVVGAVLVWQLGPRDETTRATVGEAVSDFREAGGGGGGGGGPLFERRPGVYRYETEGSETADTGLLSATHEYDGISTITIRPSGCGVVEHWQVLGGRWSEFTSCPTEGDLFELKGLIEYHEFFGRSRESKFRCTGDAASDRSSRQVGKRFQGRCVSKDGDTATSSTLVAGIERVRVGDETFPAVHTVSDVELEGGTEGTAARQDWRRRSDGLLLKRTARSEVETSGALDGDYEEGYTIRLLSVEPET